MTGFLILNGDDSAGPTPTPLVQFATAATITFVAQSLSQTITPPVTQGDLVLCDIDCVPVVEVKLTIIGGVS